MGDDERPEELDVILHVCARLRFETSIALQELLLSHQRTRHPVWGYWCLRS
jgi:hypothetical protein